MDFKPDLNKNSTQAIVLLAGDQYTHKLLGKTKPHPVYLLTEPTKVGSSKYYVPPIRLISPTQLYLYNSKIEKRSIMQNGGVSRRTIQPEGTTGTR